MMNSFWRRRFDATLRLFVSVASCCAFMVSGLPALAQSVTFDFDSATPSLETGQNVPFDQISSGVTGQFKSASGGFSVQNSTSYPGLLLSRFSGNYLYPNIPSSVLEIQFSRQITNITFTFATAENPAIETPTPIRLVAYTNSAGTPAVGSATARGEYGSDTLPMGSLSFSSSVPFNLVRINIQPGGGTGVLVDNIIVQPAAPGQPSLQWSASLNDPFFDDLNATIDAAHSQITTILRPGSCFYRLRYEVPSTILQVDLLGDQARLTYQLY